MSSYESWIVEEWGYLDNMYHHLVSRLQLLIKHNKDKITIPTFDEFCKFVYSNSKDPFLYV